MKTKRETRRAFIEELTRGIKCHARSHSRRFSPRERPVKPRVYRATPVNIDAASGMSDTRARFEPAIQRSRANRITSIDVRDAAIERHFTRDSYLYGRSDSDVVILRIVADAAQIAMDVRRPAKSLESLNARL